MNDEELDKTIPLEDKTIRIEPGAHTTAIPIGPQKSEEEKEKTTFFGIEPSWFHSIDINEEIVRENIDQESDNRTALQCVQEENPFPELIEEEKLYDVLRAFNGGGQGVIFRAQDRALDRQIAVKSLRKEFLDNPSARKSFITEAKISAQLEHPSIIPVYSLTGDGKKGLHLAMKMIHGMTLSSYLSEICRRYKEKGIRKYNEGKSLLFRLDLFLRICDALSYVHNRNIMHRDLKPENIIIGDYREVYVMDWGIASHIVKNKDEEESSPEDKKHIWGTPRYMAPEVIRGEGGDQRADIYALGVMLFEIVYLKPCFTANELKELLEKVKLGRCESFRHAYGFRISTELAAIIRKAITPDLHERYKHTDDLARDLRRYLAGEETAAKPDGYFGKVFRWMGHHRQLMGFSMMLLLLYTFANLAYGMYQQRNAQIFQRRYNRMRAEVSIRAARTAYEIEQKLISLETFLKLICENAEIRLKNPAEKNGEKPIPFLTRHNGSFFSGSSYSPAYKIFLNLDHVGYFVARSHADSLTAQEEIARLAPVFPEIRKRFLSAGAMENGENLSPSELKQGVLNGENAMLWFYIGMESGLYLQYPCSDALPDSYDPRKRPWYITARKSSGESLVWSKPYLSAQTSLLVLTCTKAFREKGKLSGAASFDVLLDRFRESMDHFGNDNRFTMGKYILDEEGNILVAGDQESDSVWQGRHRAEKNGMPNLDQLGSGALWQQMKAMGSGIIPEDTPAGRRFYVFFPIRSMKWVYVEVVAMDRYFAANLSRLDREDPFKKP